MPRKLSAIKKSDQSYNVDLQRIDKQHQVVYGVVYEPNAVDTHGETITEEAVLTMAWDFISEGKYAKIDVQHTFKESGCSVVESFIARDSDPDFPVGSWVLGVRCTDSVWKSVLSGELNGFSLGGYSINNTEEIKLTSVVKEFSGNTEESTVDILPPHTHEYTLKYENSGKLRYGITKSNLGHTHDIKAETATEKSFDHAHRFKVR